MWTRIASFFLSRPVVASAAVLLVAIILGCMHASKDRAVIVDRDGLLRQHGTVSVAAGDEVDVFYPRAYANTPYLQITSALGSCEAKAQYPDHFRVKNNGVLAREAHWEAKGDMLPPPPPPPPPPVVVPGGRVPPPPPPGLPLEPRPVLPN